jgi:hypothetical protein
VTSETIEPMLTPLQVAELLALKGTDEVKERQVRRLASKGKIPGAVKVGRTLRFKPFVVKAWIEGKGDVAGALRKVV